MKIQLLLLFAAISLSGCSASYVIDAEVNDEPETFCNPVNLNYRFMLRNGGEGIREAADPVMVTFKGKYYLFASKSSGYWYSDNCAEWNYIPISGEGTEIEDYAPGIFEYDGYLYYVGPRHLATIYRSSEPDTGKWERAGKLRSGLDPGFLVEDGRLYLYLGCSNKQPIKMRNFDIRTFGDVSTTAVCFDSNTEDHGWERFGPENDSPAAPWIEGAWMTKHDGRYYLQYACPGTQWNIYADGVYIADSPEGPFTYMENSPVSYKPGGFIGGAGHGSLCKSLGGEYWKAATNAVSVRHIFERRISLYPSGFDEDGYLYTDTYLGDYPTYLPDRTHKTSTRKTNTHKTSTHKTPYKASRPGWMLVSFRKPVQVSSALSGYPGTNTVDEEVRSSWVAETNTADEWLQIDLEDCCTVNAIQVNFDEYGATQKGYSNELFQSYRLTASVDGIHWYTIADQSEKRTDNPHDYIEFRKGFEARYIRFENVAGNVSGHLSLRELRVFGLGHGDKPSAVDGTEVVRNPEDPCKASISWNEVDDADGYNVCFGIAPDKLYNSIQVIGKSHVQTSALNRGTKYCFRVDSYNRNGITEGEEMIFSE